MIHHVSKNLRLWMHSSSLRTTSQTLNRVSMQDLTVFTEVVMEYFAFCMGAVTVVKHIRGFPNQKPWMTTEVRPPKTP